MNKINAVVEKLKEYGAEKIILFGSAAKREIDEYSDLDFLMIKKTRLRFLRRLIEVGKILREFGKVDVFIYTPKEFEKMKEMRNPFIERALKEGKVVYEKK
ncbi:MAG: nucleotidyltransferase domain-containing protein [Candidatus Altiarchaeota archaeon]